MKTVEHKSTNTISRSAMPFFRKANGNTTVQTKGEDHTFFRSGNSAHPVQAELNVSQPNDPHEKEADNVAHKVVQRMNSNDNATKQEDKGSNNISPVVQKKDINLKEEDNPSKQPKDENMPIHRQATEKQDDKTLQKKSNEPVKDEKPINRKQEKQDFDDNDIMVHRKNTELDADNQHDQLVIENKLNDTKGSGEPLPTGIRKNLESAMDADFSGVRIHTDQMAVQLNKELNAHAFTHGNDIYFNTGKFDDSSIKGTELLAHELTHTIQQGTSAKHNRLAGSRENETLPHSTVSRAAFISNSKDEDDEDVDPPTTT